MQNTDGFQRLHLPFRSLSIITFDGSLFTWIVGKIEVDDSCMVCVFYSRSTAANTTDGSEDIIAWPLLSPSNRTLDAARLLQVYFTAIAMKKISRTPFKVYARLKRIGR